jgi:hypothetical protein
MPPAAIRAHHAIVHIRVRSADQTRTLMDMLPANKHAGDRKRWLEIKGELACLEALTAETGDPGLV